MVRIVESSLDLGRICACSPSRGGKGSGNPAPKLADRWKSAVWLGKSDLTDEHLVRKNGVVYARSVRRLAEHNWSENTGTTETTLDVDIPPAADPVAPPPAVPEVHDHRATIGK